MFLSNRPQAASLQHHRVHHEARTIILDTSRAGVQDVSRQASTIWRTKHHALGSAMLAGTRSSPVRSSGLAALQMEGRSMFGRMHRTSAAMPPSRLDNGRKHALGY